MRTLTAALGAFGLMAAAIGALAALAVHDITTHGDGIGDEGMWI